MEDKQCINCTVGSCVYNNETNKKCTLKSIVVEPCFECSDGEAEDESMCGNYECKYNNGEN